MCELFYNLVLGVVSGVISSTIVSLVIMYHQNKRQFSTDFFNDKQACARYFQAIRIELFLCERRNDYSDLSALLRVYEESPMRPSFNYLEENDAKKWSEVFQYLCTLEQKIQNNEINSPAEGKEISGKLFKYSITVLKLRCKKMTICEALSYSK